MLNDHLVHSEHCVDPGFRADQTELNPNPNPAEDQGRTEGSEKLLGRRQTLTKYRYKELFHFQSKEEQSAMGKEC